MNRVRICVWVSLALLSTVLFVVPLPSTGRVWGSFQDMLHAPLFALMAAWLYRECRSRFSLPPWVLMPGCWMVAVAAGAIVELLQSFVGRYATLSDIWANACGALAGILWVYGKSKSRERFGYWIAAGIALAGGFMQPVVVLQDVIRQRLEMPMLASFEREGELMRWDENNSAMQRIRLHATDGQWSLQVELQSGSYPGIVLSHPAPDWSGFDGLLVGIFVSDGAGEELTVKIEDWEHTGDFDDRFHQSHSLVDGKQRIRVRLAEVAQAPRSRTLDLTRIHRLGLFSARPRRPVTFFVDHIRLR